MGEPWAFGWNQVFTIVGFVLTIGIAVGGFRTFDRWKREKIEERRIDIALEALAIAYEAQEVFESIRSPGSFPYESEDMARREGQTEADRMAVAPYYVTLKRLDNQKDFFIQVSKLKPRFMAAFGPETAKLFDDLGMARVHMVVSAQSLMRRPERHTANQEEIKRRARHESDIWTNMDEVYDRDELPEGDRVRKLVEGFRDGIAQMCRPVLDRKFKAG